jgi:hypothetical protein
MATLSGKRLIRLFRLGLALACIYAGMGCSDAECDQKICALDCSASDAVLNCTRGSVVARVLSRNQLGEVVDYRLSSSLGLFTTCHNEYVGSVRTGYYCNGECQYCSCTLVTRHGELVCE